MEITNHLVIFQCCFASETLKLMAVCIIWIFFKELFLKRNFIFKKKFKKIHGVGRLNLFHVFNKSANNNIVLSEKLTNEGSMKSLTSEIRSIGSVLLEISRNWEKHLVCK